MISSTQTSITPILIPALNGILRSLRGFFSSEAKAIRELARVFIRIPNQQHHMNLKYQLLSMTRINKTPPIPKSDSPS